MFQLEQDLTIQIMNKNYYVKCWSFICGESQISIKSGSGKRYNSKEYKFLEKADVIEVIVYRNLGNLSF